MGRDGDRVGCRSAGRKALPNITDKFPTGRDFYEFCLSRAKVCAQQAPVARLLDLGANFDVFSAILFHLHHTPHSLTLSATTDALYESHDAEEDERRGIPGRQRPLRCRPGNLHRASEKEPPGLLHIIVLDHRELSPNCLRRGQLEGGRILAFVRGGHVRENIVSGMLVCREYSRSTLKRK